MKDSFWRMSLSTRYLRIGGMFGYPQILLRRPRNVPGCGLRRNSLIRSWVGKMKIEVDFAANARNFQYLAGELQGIATFPASFG